MFIGPQEKSLIAAWASQNGWSNTIAKRNFTVYRALEWLAACLEGQLEETDKWFWCQQERIAACTGMSRPTVRAAIEGLVEAKWIEHERRWLPQAEALCSWFRLKVPPSCAGRVRRAARGVLQLGLQPPAPGTSKNSTRRVQNFYAPSSSYKREISKRSRADVIQEIQDRCMRRGLDPQAWAPQLVETAETVLREQQRAEKQARKVRSAGVCDPLDVKLKEEQEAAAS